MSTQALKAAATGGETPANMANMKPRDQIAHLLKSKQGEIAKMLPKHLNAERLLKVAQIAATTTPALAKCDVPSLIGAIGQCAQMGLEPNTVLGHAYLVPFNTKRKDANGNDRWVNSVQVVIGYKGLIDLARRSGQIVSIAAHEVCENDEFELVYGLDEKLVHTPSLGERGQIIGFYAVAKLKDGGHCFEFMSVRQIHEIRDASLGYQQAVKFKKQDAHPWAAHFVEMGRKTAIRRLAKYLPLSIEFQTAATLDGMAEGGKDQHLDEALDGDFAIIPDGAQDHAWNVDQETGEIKEDHPAQVAGAAGWQPSAEDQAEIQARELAEAGEDSAVAAEDIVLAEIAAAKSDSDLNQALRDKIKALPSMARAVAQDAYNTAKKRVMAGAPGATNRAAIGGME